MASQDIKIGVQFEEKGNGLKTATQEFQNIQKSISSIQSGLNNLKLPSNMTQGFTNTFKDLEKEFAKIDKYIGSGFKTKGDVTGYEKSINQVSHLMEKLNTQFQNVDVNKLRTALSNINTTELQQANQQLIQAQTNLANFLNNKQGDNQTITDIKTIVDELSKLSSSSFLKGDNGILNALKAGDFQGVNQAYQELISNHRQFKDSTKETAWTDWTDLLKKAITDLANSPELQKFITELNNASINADNIRFTQVENGVESMRKLGQASEETAGKMTPLGEALVGSAQGAYELSNASEQFGNKIKYFFSATSAVRLFRKAVTEAYNTVKELDEVMTETAVVTDFTVGDMWDQLPTYAKQASDLGVSIKSAYESATLYYQQGLKTNEVMALSNSTLKMARIAGLEAAEATDRMTNALRGFNMELNETSAERVADVYSKIASITASNVDEISTAMTKTASLASSANMSFENTAAFLAQIIETTRESADTAGTALKTVIARFAEIKENPAEMLSVDGEEVSYNKVDAALQSVGISLDKFMKGEEGLDSVFMRLSERWDSLDLSTQRYIATMAAGSRQQSRFIALMQDYGRMQELTGEAMDASGASASQYAKTLDSLQSKLNALENEWNQFTMGLANSDWIKTVVDGLTTILKLLNKITESFGDTGGAIVKVAGLIGTLAIGKTLAKSFQANLITPLSQYGLQAGQQAGQATAKGYVQTFGAGLKQAKTDVGKWFGKTAFNQEALTSNNNAIDNAYKNNIQNQSVFAHGDTKFQTMSAAYSTYRAEMQAATTDQERFNAQIKFTNTYEKEMGKTIPGVTNAVEQQSTSMQKMALTMAACAAALNALVNWIANLEGVTDGTKEVLKSVSSGLTALMIALTALPSVLSAIGSALGAASLASGPVVLAISAIIAGLVVLISLISKAAKANSYEGKLEKITKAQDNFNEVLQESNEELEELEDKLAEINNNEDAFDGLIRGSTAFQKAVAQANSSVLELLDSYPELAAFVQVGDYGELTLDKDKTNEFLEQKQAANNRAQIASQMYNAMAANLTLSNEKKLAANADLDILGNKVQNIIDSNPTYREQGAVGYNIAEVLKQQADANGGSLDLNDNATIMALRGALPNASDELIQKAYEAMTSLDTTIATSTNGIISSSAQLEGQFQSAIQTSVDSEIANDNIGKNLISSISQASTENYDNLYSAALKDIEDTYNSQDLLEQQYMKQFGLTKQQITEKDIESEQMRGDLANLQMIENATANVEALYKAIGNGNAPLERLNNIVASDLDEYSRIKQEYSDSNQDGLISSWIAEAASEMKVSPAELAKMYGFEETEQGIYDLGVFFSQKFDDLAEQAEKVEAKFVNSIGKELKGDQKRINQLIEQTNISQKKSILDGLDHLKSMSIEGIQDFFDALGTGTAESIDEALSVVNSVTGTDAINDYATLKEIANNTNYSENKRNYAAQLMQENAFGSGAQLRQYLQSSDYTDKKKTIGKKVNSKNGFNDTDVEELAQDSELLSQMLDNGALSASNLAKTLTGLKTGSVVIEGLTDRVVDAVNQFKSLEDVAKETSDNIEEFNAGTSSSGLVTQLDEYAQDFEELITKHNAFGDPQTEKYLKLFLSDEYANSILNGDELEIGANAMEQIRSIMKDIVAWTQGNGVNFWDDYATGAIQAADALQITKEAFGEYTVTLEENITTQQLIQKVQEATGLSADMASAQVLKLLSLNSEVKKQLDEADYNQAIQSFANGSVLDSAGKLQISNEELQNLHAYTGAAIETIKEDIAKAKNIQVEQIVEFDIEAVYKGPDGTTNDLASQIDSIVSQFGKTGANAKVDLLAEWNVLTSTGNIDYEKFQEQMTGMGFTEDETKKLGEEWADEIDKKLAQEVESFTYVNDEYVPKIEEAASDTVDGLAESAEDLMDHFEAQAWWDTIYSAVYAANNQIKKDEENAEKKANTKQLSEDEKKEIRSYIDNAGAHSKTATFGDSTLSTLAGSTASYRKEDTRNQINGYGGYSSKKTTTTKTTATASNTGTTYSMVFADDDVGNAMDDISDKLKKIENDIDKLVNINEKIRQTTAGVTIFGKAYDNLMNYGNSIHGGDRNTVNLSELMERRLGQLESYNAQIDAIQEANEQRASEASELASQYSNFFAYDADTNTVGVNYDAFQAYEKEYNTTDALNEHNYNIAKDEYDEAKKALEKVQGYAEDIESSNEELFDIQSAIEEMKLEGLSETSSLIERVASALQAIETQRVDKLEELYTAINEAQSKIVSKMQEQIDESRKQRELAETQKDLDEKRRRIAYLQQDTSGGNALEIKQLQEELEDAEQDYTDTLIDNFISKMEIANNNQQEQNETQISLQRKLIEQNQENGSYSRAALQTIANSIDENGNVLLGENSPIVKVLTAGEQWQQKTGVQITEEKSGLRTDLAKSGIYLINNWKDVLAANGDSSGFATQNGLATLEEELGIDLLGDLSATSVAEYIAGPGSNLVEETAYQTETITAKLDSMTSGILTQIKNAINDIDVNVNVSGGSSGSNTGSSDEDTDTGNTGGSGGSGGTTTGGNAKIKALQEWITKYWGWTLVADGKYSIGTTNAVKDIQETVNTTVDGKYGTKTASALANWIERLHLGWPTPSAVYKTGGLADFTGPAWLDGTKSKPELVLNATDTQTFMKFVESMRQWDKNSNSNATSQNNGVSYYNIDINVDEIASEDDVNNMMDQISLRLQNANAYNSVFAARR